MQRSIFSATMVMLAVLVLAPNLARAGIGACGNIDVEASAQCELIAPSAECELECTPISVEAACAAQLTAECEGQCDASAEVDCNTECQAGCVGDCEVEPGKFDCEAECRADCSAGCQGQCEASGEGGSCEASCRATCSAECSGSCEVELPEVDCDAKCEASCEGSCRAEANIDCQVQCQGEAFADCEAEVTGGCEAACQGEEGALFCDGQYVDHGGNLEECANALRAALDIEVKGYAEAEAGCEGNTCEAEASAGVSCDCSALPGRTGRVPAISLFFVAVGLMIASRRRFFG